MNCPDSDSLSFESMHNTLAATRRAQQEGVAVEGRGMMDKIWGVAAGKAVVMSATILAAFMGSTATSEAQSSADDLSQKLANPLANLISVPLQGNYDFKAGAKGDGFAFTLNVQPVIPFSVNEDWNLITRTIIPISYRDYMPGGSVTGLGDINASFFFSPKEPANGLIWGAGPVFLLPTATDDYLGTGKFGLGPTAVALVQQDKWTVGGLANHIWSVAGDGDRQDVSVSLLQPFVSYNFGHGTSASVSVDSTYDWEASQWTAPVNFGVTQVFQVGLQAMSFQVGGRYYAEAPSGGPDWGLRTTLTFLFPK